ncbi:MAG: sialidase family protein, partial [Haloechinothrix sp.]
MERPVRTHGRRIIPAQPASLATSILYQDPRHYAKNPDFCLLPEGRLLCVFLEADQHVPFAYARIVLMESADGGQSWDDCRLIAESAPVESWGTVADRVTREPWVTPRISRLRDGRLVIVCDKDDFSHAHESQPPGIYAWWSSDDGESWSEPANTGVPGIEPDQVVELPDGTLLLATHFLVAATGKLGQFVARSHDGGQTWEPVVKIASDDVHNYCEGAIIPLPSGQLVCVIRENNHNNYPCYLS